MEKSMKKFEVFIDKHFNVKGIWLGKYKILHIKNIKMFCTPEGTRITFEVLPHGIEFKFWEDEYGT